MTPSDLKRWRDMLGLRSLRAAAEALGVSERAYAAWERGEQKSPRWLYNTCLGVCVTRAGLRMEANR